MSDREPYEFGSAQIEVRHYPDSEADSPSSAYDDKDAKTGFVDVGVVVDGAFIPFYRENAGAVFKRIDQAQQERATQASESGEPAPSDQ